MLATPFRSMPLLALTLALLAGCGERMYYAQPRAPRYRRGYYAAPAPVYGAPGYNNGGYYNNGVYYNSGYSDPYYATPGYGYGYRRGYSNSYYGGGYARPAYAQPVYVSPAQPARPMYVAPGRGRFGR